MSKPANGVKRKNKYFNVETINYQLMLLPGIILLLIFSVIPMVGILIAFQNYVPAKGLLGSKWVGLANFTYMFQIPDVSRIFWNTLIIAVSKIIMGIIVPVIFALLLNEAKNAIFKRTVQTIVYLPYFLSWVILGNIFITMLSLDGIVNQLVQALGFEPIMFPGSNTWFRPIIIITDSWKGFGYGAIIYLAALLAIDPNLNEAAAIDGAGRFKQLLHVTLPSLVPTIVLMTTLSLGSILSAGFDQIFNLYNTLVYETGDIIDTYGYRMGLIDMQYSLSTAVGLLKSVISSVLIVLSYWLANKFTGYHIF